MSDGLFNVMLGSLTPIPQTVVTGNNSLWLGITVGTDDEMAPRVQLGSVPFAVQALTVPDGSITTAKIADGAVTSAKIDSSLAVSENLVVGNAGSTIPSRRLEVYDSSDAIIKGSGNQTTDAAFAEIEMVNRAGSRSIIAALRDGADNSSKLLFYNKEGGSDVVRMAIGANGNVTVYGNLQATGAKSAVIQAGEFGPRKLYAAESPEVRFFDEGLARLNDGVVRVGLDPVFLETIEGQYLVHVTPYGDASLYVAEVGKDYFVVKAREDDPDVAFAWRLSAIRKGYAGVRLEEVK